MDGEDRVPFVELTPEGELKLDLIKLGNEAVNLGSQLRLKGSVPLLHGEAKELL